MEKLTSFCKKHFVPIVGGAVVILILTVGYFGCQTDELQQTVTNQTNQANQAVKQAVNAQNSAVNVSIERRTEDAARTRIIQPKLDAARRKSQNSKAALEAARKTHNEKKTDTSNLSRSSADNCRQLAGLFPDIQFEDCQ